MREKTTATLSNDNIKIHSIGWDKGNWEQGNHAANHMRKVDPPVVAMDNQRAFKLDNGQYTSGKGEEIVGQYNGELTHCSMRHMSLCTRVKWYATTSKFVRASKK